MTPEPPSSLLHQSLADSSRQVPEPPIQAVSWTAARFGLAQTTAGRALHGERMVTILVRLSNFATEYGCEPTRQLRMQIPLPIRSRATRSGTELPLCECTWVYEEATGAWAQRGTGMVEDSRPIVRDARRRVR